MYRKDGLAVLPIKGGDSLSNAHKQGIDYFSLSVDFLDDIKVRKIMRACGGQSIVVLISLLSRIYRFEGYFIKWDPDVRFLVADHVGAKESLVQEIVEKAVNVGFFDANIFDTHSILTSKGIQKRFFDATSRRKRVYCDATLMLISEDVYINRDNVYINTQNVCKNEQSKVKESKVKESKAVLKKPTVAAAFTDEDDKDFEEVKNYFESYVKFDLSSMRDQVAITKALKEYPKDFVLQAMKSIVDRGSKNIVSFSYFEPVLVSAWEEKNKPKKRQHVGRKKKEIIGHDYQGIDFNKILEEKQRQMMEDAANG